MLRFSNAKGLHGDLCWLLVVDYWKGSLIKDSSELWILQGMNMSAMAKAWRLYSFPAILCCCLLIYGQGLFGSSQNKHDNSWTGYFLHTIFFFFNLKIILRSESSKFVLIQLCHSQPKSWDSPLGVTPRFLEAGPVPGTHSYTVLLTVVRLPAAEECTSCGTGNEKWNGPAPSGARL